MAQAPREIPINGPIYLSPIQRIVGFSFGSADFAFARFLATAPTRIRSIVFNNQGSGAKAPAPVDVTPIYSVNDTIPGQGGYRAPIHSFSRDKRSFIAILPTEELPFNLASGELHYIYRGVEIAVKTDTNFIDRNTNATGMAPDGRAWWASLSGTDGDQFIQSLQADAKFDVMKIGPDEVSMQTHSFPWWDVIEPLVQDIGLSSWDDGAGGPGYRRTVYTSDGIFVNLQADAIIVGTQKNILRIWYGYVTSDILNESVQRVVTVKTRVIIAAINSKFITRQSDGPDPGEPTILFDETLSADFIDPSINLQPTNIPDGASLHQPHTRNAFITARGNVLVSTQHTNGAAGTDDEVKRILVNGAEVHEFTAQDISPILFGKITDTAANGLRFIFQESGGSTYFYNNGAKVNLGILDEDTVVTLTENGDHLLHYTGSAVRLLDAAGAQLAERADVAFPSGFVQAVDYDDPAVFYGIEGGAPKKYKIMGGAITVVGDMPLVPATVDVDGTAFNRISSTSYVPFSMIPNYQS